MFTYHKPSPKLGATNTIVKMDSFYLPENCSLVCWMSLDLFYKQMWKITFICLRTNVHVVSGLSHREIVKWLVRYISHFIPSLRLPVSLSSSLFPALTSYVSEWKNGRKVLPAQKFSLFNYKRADWNDNSPLLQQEYPDSQWAFWETRVGSCDMRLKKVSLSEDSPTMDFSK